MSFKGIRSRLRNPSESDQGSPSRLSFFHQLTALLSDDDQRLHEEVSSGRLFEEELLTLVADFDTEQESAAMGAETGGRDLLDVPTDRDSPSPAVTPTDGEVPTILRNRALQNCTERPTRRHRFSSRDKKCNDRSKSRERPSNPPPIVLCPSSTEETLSSNHQTRDGEETNGGSRKPHNRITAWAKELVNDLQVMEEANGKEEESPGDSLSMKRLKKNMLRFGEVTQPISSFSDCMQSLRQWESPTASLLLILVLVYVLWHDLSMTLIISVSLYKLTMNYLTTHVSTRGWLVHFGWTFDVETVDEEASSSDRTSSTGVTDRLAVLVQVARKVQNQLRSVCDAAEKVKNLLMWRHEASRQLYIMLWLALPMTLLMSSSQIFTLVGFYFVLKLFVIDFVFLRFPRLRDKYDTSAQIWHDLPTDADLDARRKTDQGHCNTAAQGQNSVVDHRTFCESFNLPITETPVPGWQNGLRSTLVNRDKSLTSAFKTGRLFLTANYLCFERSKTHPEKNVVVPLDRIVRLEKGNQYSWIPGGGMIIEVFIQGLDRAYTFGAIMNRDEVFAAIRDAAEKKGCLWRED